MRPVRLSALLTAALPLWLPTVAKAQQTPPPIPTQLPPWQGWHGHMWGDGMGWPMFWGGPFMMILVVFCVKVILFLWR